MDEIRKKIIELADLKYKEFHSSLCPKTDNIIGVRVPVLRNYAKDLAKQDYRKYLNDIGNDYYEEIMLKGMIIGLANMELEERLYYLKEFIPLIDNWAVCDVTCSGLKFTKTAYPQMWEFLKHYIGSDQEFEIRFALVMLLNYYITQEYIDDVLIILNQIKHKGYYVKMAIAWTISMAYIKYPQKTMKFLNNNQLDNFTYNKALQKILESYRVTKQDKEIIRSMKRK